MNVEPIQCRRGVNRLSGGCGTDLRSESGTNSGRASSLERIAESLERQEEFLKRLADHFDPKPPDVEILPRRHRALDRAALRG